MVDNKPVAPPTLEELKAQVAAALKSGDDTAFMTAVAQIAKRKAEVAKAQAEAALKEAQALAGIREKLATALFQEVKKALPGLAKRLQEVKAHGFTYSLDEPDANGVLVTHKSVALSVPVIKQRKASTGGGAKGTSSAEYGMSLGAIFEKFATADDKAKLAAATSGSAQWQVKVAVKKGALAAGLLKPLT